MPTGEVHYKLETTLSHHGGPITVLQFSLGGEYLASGSDNGVILVYSTSSWKPIRQFVDASPVSVLLWHNKASHILLCGHRSGDLHLVDVSKGANPVVGTARFSGSIHSLAISPSSNALVISNGHNIQLVKFSSRAPYLKGDPKKLPSPPAFSQLSGRLPAPIARSLHFQKDGKSLVASYLSHGIICWNTSEMVLAWQITPRACSIGRSALHPNGSTIAVSNLFDGVDWYSISPQKHANSVKIPISDNLPTPLCYIHGGSALLVGGTSGKAHIIDCRSLNELQAMDHNDNGCIQSVAFTPNTRGRALIATGNAEQMGGALVKVWSKPTGGTWEFFHRSRDLLSDAVCGQYQTATMVTLGVFCLAIVHHLLKPYLVRSNPNDG